MQSRKVWRTNILISLILIVGFSLTAFFSYRANYQASISTIENVSKLSAEGIHYQFTNIFTKPVNISLAMSHDSLLIEHLHNEETALEEGTFIPITKEYLQKYYEEYGFDSVFLVSVKSGRYYNFNGFDRILEEGNEENDWYFELLESDLEYTLNVDNDEVSGADNEITTFVNCKIENASGEVIGVVGVGIRAKSLTTMLAEYEEEYKVHAQLINTDGEIEISTTHTGYKKEDWFTIHKQEKIREQILRWRDSVKNLELWNIDDQGEESFLVVHYIPEISWMLLVEQDTGGVVAEMRAQLNQTIFILVLVVTSVLAIVTTLIHKFNKQIMELVEERQDMFKQVTETLYDSIYELNLTRNCYVGKKTEEYFATLGAGGLPFDEGLKAIARNQIKEEYREQYVQLFSSENAIREFNAGNTHLTYEFKITLDGKTYHWIRVDAFMFYSEEDGCIHMFSYRKNIDKEKKQEKQAATDEMTGFYTKSATGRLINQELDKKEDKRYAFFIFDIDNFKQVNDHCGHVFGDCCIKRFTKIIQGHFTKDVILGRIGGDEFVAFMPIQSEQWVLAKGEELNKALDTCLTKNEVQWHISSSIGIAISPQDGCTFEDLYRCADEALYETKQKGKNGYTKYHRT